MAACGYQSGVITDGSRSNWHNNAQRPIAWSAWYPTEECNRANKLLTHFFEMGNAIRDAPLCTAGEFSVVLMSHGTGGTAESIGWLGRSLACAGYVVIGANHHGNCGLEPYSAEGFLCWWERATDLSVLLTSLNAQGFFANRLDLSQVSAVGFSLGSHTVLALAGARTSMDVFEKWREANNIIERGPEEFSDAAEQIPNLVKSSEAFRRSWALHGDDFTDTRINSFVAIAPAPPIRSFTSQSIKQLHLPVTILTGGSDQEAPSEHCSDWLMRQNSTFRHHDMGANVGHYTFLDCPSEASLIGQVDIFSDHGSIDRKQVHKQAAEIILAALR